MTIVAKSIGLSRLFARCWNGKNFNSQLLLLLQFASESDEVTFLPKPLLRRGTSGLELSSTDLRTRLKSGPAFLAAAVGWDRTGPHLRGFDSGRCTLFSQ